MSLWILIVLILAALSYTSVSLQPFSHQPLPYPSFLIRVILSASVARFVVMATRMMLVRDQSVGQSGHSRVDIFYNVFSAVTNLICLGYHENLLLGLTSSFMEVSSTPLECCRLIELARKNFGSESYRKTTILSCALCVVFRGALPLLFLFLATSQESPLKMSDLPLVWFFISGVFYVIFHVFFLYQSVRRVQMSRTHSTSLPSPCQSLSPTTPFSMPGYPAVLSNDILEHKSPLADSDHYHLKDFNYGLLRSYDNRNLCSTAGVEEGEKMNVLKKKDVSKNSLLHRMARSSEGEMLKKFLLNRRMCKGIERTSSEDVLLESPTLSVKDETELQSVHGVDNRLEQENEASSGSDGLYCRAESARVKGSTFIPSSVNLEDTDRQILTMETEQPLARLKDVSKDTGNTCLDTGSIHRHSFHKTHSSQEKDLIRLDSLECPSHKVDEPSLEANLQTGAGREIPRYFQKHSLTINLRSIAGESTSDDISSGATKHKGPDLFTLPDTDASMSSRLPESELSNQNVSVVPTSCTHRT